MRDCVTHHFACDCREEKFKELEKQLAEEQSRTLRYKELLYSHTERGGRIKELEKQLAEKDGQLSEAVEVIGFYGDTKNWEPFTEAYSEYVDDEYAITCATDCIAEPDTEEIKENLRISGREVSEWYGGKRARDFLKKWGGRE